MLNVDGNSSENAAAGHVPATVFQGRSLLYGNEIDPDPERQRFYYQKRLRKERMLKLFWDLPTVAERSWRMTQTLLMLY